MAYQRRGQHWRPLFPTVKRPAAPAAPAPDPRRISRIAFLQRIATETRVDIRLAAKEIPRLEDYLAMLDAATLIELDHPDTLAGVGFLLMAELITEAEAEALLA